MKSLKFRFQCMYKTRIKVIDSSVLCLLKPCYDNLVHIHFGCWVNHKNTINCLNFFFTLEFNFKSRAQQEHAK